MDTAALIIGVSWIAGGLICIGFSVPLIRGKVGRNPVYGIRLPQAMQSDEAWFAINRYGGRRMALWSVPMILAGLIALGLPLQSRIGLAMACAFGPLIFALVPVWESWRFARRYPAAR